MRDVNDLKPTIPYHVRHKSITKANNIDEKLKTERERKYKDIEYSSEAFNDYDILREPNKIGITMYYPNKTNPSHTLCRVFNFDIGMKELGIEIKKMYKQLSSKIPKMRDDND